MSSTVPLMPLFAVNETSAIAAFPAVTVTVCAAGGVYALSVLATVYVPGETPLKAKSPFESVVVVPVAVLPFVPA